MIEKLSGVIAVIGIDIGKNSFHVVGLDERGASALRQKWSRGQVETVLFDSGRRRARLNGVAILGRKNFKREENHASFQFRSTFVPADGRGWAGRRRCRCGDR